MHTVNQVTFMAVLSAYGTSREVARERDGEYLYETYFGPNNEEIAFVSYRDGSPLSWHVADHTVL